MVKTVVALSNSPSLLNLYTSAFERYPNYRLISTTDPHRILDDKVENIRTIDLLITDVRVRDMGYSDLITTMHQRSPLTSFMLHAIDRSQSLRLLQEQGIKVEYLSQAAVSNGEALIAAVRGLIGE